MLLGIFMYKFCVDVGFISLGYMSRPGIAGSFLDSMFNLWMNCQTFPKLWHHFTSPPVWVRVWEVSPAVRPLIVFILVGVRLQFCY